MAVEKTGLEDKQTLQTRYVNNEYQLKASEITTIKNVVDNNADELEDAIIKLDAAEDNAALVSYEDIAEATSYWDVSKEDGVSIYIESEEEFYKWASAETDKVLPTGRKNIRTTDDPDDEDKTKVPVLSAVDEISKKSWLEVLETTTFVNGYIDTSGVPNSNTDWRRTGLTPVSSDEVYEYYLSSSAPTGTYMDVAFYGETGYDDFLGGIEHVGGVGYDSEQLAFPSGIAYMEFTKNATDPDSDPKLYSSPINALVLSAKNRDEKLDAEQTESLIISSSKYEIASDSDLEGGIVYSAPTQKAFGQYYQTIEQVTFNRVKAGFDVSGTEYDVEFKVFYAETKTGVVANMTLVQAYVFDETNLPVEDNIITLDLDNSLTLNSGIYVYVIGFSGNGVLETARETNSDRFLFVNDASLSSFPTSLAFAISDYYGTTGVNLYNNSYLANKLSVIDENTTNIEELTNKYVVDKEISFTNQLDLINGLDYTIYKSSIIRDSSKLNESLLYARISSATPFRVSRYETGVDDLTFNFDGNYKLTEILLRGNDDLTATYSIPLTINTVDYDVKSGQTETWLPIGDSLTNRGVANYTKLYNSAISTGLNINTIGTATNNGSLLGEGREGWTFLNFIGKSNRHAFTNDVVYSPFMKLADSSDKSNHPEWCFERTDSSGELSLSETTDTGQDFYIFDLDNYLSVNALSTPTKISIALGTNDLTVYGSGAIDNVYLALDIMLSQIKTSLPSVDIAVVSGTVKGDNISSEYRSNQFDLINAIQDKVDDLSLSNVKILPVYAFQNQSFIFDYDSETLLNDNGNYTIKNVLNENIHFRGVGYYPYAQLMTGWMLNN